MGGLCYCYKVCWPGSDRMCAWEKGRGSGHHGVLGIFAWKKGRGSWCHGVSAILLPAFRGALGRGTCLEYLLGKRDGELVPRGACDIATNVSGSPGKGKMLGTLSRRSPLLHMLCERWQKAKNAVENPLQNTVKWSILVSKRTFQGKGFCDM